MKSNHSLNDTVDQYRVEIGDTERPVEDIISDIKGYGEPIVRVTLTGKSTGLTAAGSILNIAVAIGSVDEQSLYNKLNEAGGCMYQIASVTKLS